MTNAIVNLYSNKKNEINNFLSRFLNSNTYTNSEMIKWQKNYENPIELADLIGAYIENNDKYEIAMWISLDTRNILKNNTRQCK